MKATLAAGLLVFTPSLAAIQTPSANTAPDSVAREQYVSITRHAVQSLKTNLDTFHFALEYHGADRGQYSLYLSVAPLPDPPRVNYLRARIPREQALLIIGHLGADGSLYRGSINRVKQLVLPREPYYLLLAQGAENDQYFEFIPCGGPYQWHGSTRPDIVEQLKTLRAVLTDDAGEMADKLVSAFEGAVRTDCPKG
jgi:hypothetical protein